MRTDKEKMPCATCLGCPKRKYALDLNVSVHHENQSNGDGTCAIKTRSIRRYEKSPGFSRSLVLKYISGALHTEILNRRLRKAPAIPTGAGTDTHLQARYMYVDEGNRLKLI